MRFSIEVKAKTLFRKYLILFPLQQEFTFFPYIFFFFNFFPYLTGKWKFFKIFVRPSEILNKRTWQDKTHNYSISMSSQGIGFLLAGWPLFSSPFEPHRYHSAVQMALILCWATLDRNFGKLSGYVVFAVLRKSWV